MTVKYGTNGPDTIVGGGGDDWLYGLALLWQIQFTPQSRPDPLSAVRAALKRSHDEIDDSVAHGWQAWLRWWSVDSFFPASLG